MLDNLTKNLDRRENKSWIGAANKDIMKQIVACMREKSRITLLNKVKGHTGIQGNEEADILANIGARRTR